jgi:hypothetical protein
MTIPHWDSAIFIQISPPSPPTPAPSPPAHPHCSPACTAAPPPPWRPPGSGTRSPEISETPYPPGHPESPDGSRSGRKNRRMPESHPAGGHRPPLSPSASPPACLPPRRLATESCGMKWYCRFSKSTASRLAYLLCDTIQTIHATRKVLLFIECQDDRNKLHGFRATAIIDLASAGIRPTRSKRMSTNPASRSSSLSVLTDQNLMWP